MAWIIGKDSLQSKSFVLECQLYIVFNSAHISVFLADTSFVLECQLYLVFNIGHILVFLADTP